MFNDIVCNGTHLLEVGARSEDLVHEILDREDVVLPKGLLDYSVVGERDTLLVDLAVTALVDELTHRLEVRLAIDWERHEDDHRYDRRYDAHP